MLPRTIKISYCKSYLINGSGGYLLVDTGNDSKAWRIINYLVKEKIAPERVKLIVLTHVHFDHVYGLETLKTLTGAKVVVHRSEAHLLQQGITTIPKGTLGITKLLHAVGSKIWPGIMKFPRVEPDILVDEELDLHPYGFDLQIIHTPGHTDGSISVVRPGHFAVVGDMIFGNYFSLIWPVFANDERTLALTWKKLLTMKIPVFYPGHGRKIRAGELRGMIKKRCANIPLETNGDQS